MRCDTALANCHQGKAAMIPKIRVTLLFLLAAIVTAGCGGGGGSSNPTPQQNLQSEPMSVASTTLTATDGSGNTYTVTYSSAPGAMAMFNGQNASTSTIGLTISENGAVLATEDSTAYYLTSPYSPLGLSGTTGGVAWTAVIDSYTPLPSTLTVGGSGALSSATYYDGMMNNIGSLTETYTVTANSPTAIFLNIDGAGTINGVQETETLTYSVASDGTVQALVQAVVTVNGTTLTFH
jgi:hypothetical protein